MSTVGKNFSSIGQTTKWLQEGQEMHNLEMEHDRLREVKFNLYKVAEEVAESNLIYDMIDEITFKIELIKKEMEA